MNEDTSSLCARHGHVFQSLGQWGDPLPEYCLRCGEKSPVSQPKKEKQMSGPSLLPSYSHTTVKWSGIHFDRYGTAPFWEITCPCGVTVGYGINELPNIDTPHPCGDPEHFSVTFNIVKEQK